LHLAVGWYSEYAKDMARKRKNTPGPKPDHLKLEGDWEEAVAKAVRKKKPEEGWPDDKKGKRKPE
jgi:hypothetical protein